MGKRRREESSNGAGDASSDYRAVFVDTSIGTHLGIFVSNCDSVSDFKKKMQFEHRKCFPKFGEIEIQSLKVKRGANFYHLPDVMPVWIAFKGEEGDWFLSADVFSMGNDVEKDVINIDDTCKPLGVFLPDGISGKKIVTDSTVWLEVQKSLEATTGSQNNNFSECNSMGRKKRKVTHPVVVYQGPPQKESCTLPNTETLKCQEMEKVSSLKHDSELLLPSMCKSPELTEPASMTENTTPSLSFNANTSVAPEISIGSKKKKKKRDNGRPEKATHKTDNFANPTSDSVIPSTVHASLGKEEKNICYQERDDSPLKFLNGSGIHAEVKVDDADYPMLLTKKRVVDMVNVEENMGKVSQCETDVPTLERDNQVKDKKNRGGKDTEPRKKRKKSRLMDSTVALPETKSDGKKKRKKKSLKLAADILDTTSTDQPDKDENNKLYCESEKSEARDEKLVSAEKHDSDLKKNRGGKDTEPRKKSKKSRLMDSTVALPETKSDGKKKRKKKSLKLAADILDTTSTDQPDKDENNKLYCESEKSEAQDEKLVSAEKHDSDLIMPLNCKSSEHEVPTLMPQKGSFSPSLSDANAIVGSEITSGSKKKLKKGKKRADLDQKVHGANRDEAIFFQLNQNKQIVEDVGTGKEKMREKTAQEDVERENQVLESVRGDKENIPNKDTEPIKKKNKTESNVSNIQVNLPVNEQRVDDEVLANEKKSCGIADSEEKGQVPENVHKLSINSDDPARGKIEGEEINLRQYFVPGEDICKVDSVGMVKQSSKLKGEMISGEKVKGKRRMMESPQELKGVSGVRKASGMGKGYSTQNPDEVISNSSKVPLRVSQTEAKESSRIHTDDMNVAPKGSIPNGIVSSRQKENGTVLDKSNSRRSEMLIAKTLNGQSQSGLNATNRMMVKTPQKKSLLTKLGSVFQDDSGESSADENEKLQSNYSTLGPTNSSSESEYSDGESDRTQDTSRNGSREATERSKATQKLDLSGSNGLTMDMILKSSNRFRKARLVASSQT